MYITHPKLNADQIQNKNNRSFLGGIPMTPADFQIPIFEKDQKEMTFFFQLSFPSHHPWSGYIISVFLQTTYADDDTYIPKFPEGEKLGNVDLTLDFLSCYQDFFRIFIFNALEVDFNQNYRQITSYKPLTYKEELTEADTLFGRIGSEPEWLLEDEAPRSFEGKRDLVTFLFQITEDYEYETVVGAPRQVCVDPASGVGWIESLVDRYTLFTGNELYFFGIDPPEKELVYVVPQS